MILLYFSWHIGLVETHEFEHNTEIRQYLVMILYLQLGIGFPKEKSIHELIRKISIRLTNYTLSQTGKNWQIKNLFKGKV